MGAYAAALRQRVRVGVGVLAALAAITITTSPEHHPAGTAGRPAVAHGSTLVEAPRADHRQQAARGPVTPNDPFYGAPDYRWVFDQPGFPAAWSRTLGARSVVIAVVDTGVDAGVPDLAGALLPGFDVYDHTSAIADPVGHGTAVAGVVAARTNNAVGIAGACGRCSVLPVRVSDAGGAAPVDDIAAGIAWAADHGARIINVSLAAPVASQSLVDAVAHAQAAGVLVVAAAGNDGARGVAYPAALPGVISVEAATSTGARYGFSNYGPSITLAAPGCAVVTLRDGTYGSSCGTSIAAPLVAGAAGLLAAASPSATAAELAAALEGGAARLGDTRFGRLDVAGALRELDHLRR